MTAENGHLSPNADLGEDSTAITNKSKSFLNLTSSALAGVFGSQVSLAELNGDVSREAQPAYPTRHSSSHYYSQKKPASSSLSSSHSASSRPHSPKAAGGSGAASASWSPPLSVMGLAVRVVALFVFGVLYGQFSRNLHDNHQVTTYTLDIDQTGAFSLLWGSQGIVLGFLLPFLDYMIPETNHQWKSGKSGTDWTSIIRSAAAFMGVAYGVRKLSWTSTLQAAFYWGMVNPCLWFILDGSRNGFILSCLVAFLGTTAFAIVFPSHLPSCGVLNEEYIAVVTWVASVFFCCSICFGNIGRRLLSFDRSRLLTH